MFELEVRIMNVQGTNPRFEKVQELQDKLYLAAKKSETRRFHALYDKVLRRDFLEMAWDQVKRNNGSAGIDNERIQDILANGEAAVLSEIQANLQSTRTYRPRPVRRVYIDKADGRKRALGIPTVRDRIIQTSTKELLEPIFEADFLDSSYGFRPNRSAHDALEKIRTTVNSGYPIVLDADIKGFFDNIDRSRLLTFVEQRVSDRRVLKLIRKWLNCGVLESGRISDAGQGTPQGGVISPLLANIYLHEFDKFWTYRSHNAGILVRYADDFVILFRTMEEAERGYGLAKAMLSHLGLELNEEKTRIVDTRNGKDGFDFLGFYHRQMKSGRLKRYYLQKWPSKKAMKRLRAKVRDVLGRRFTLPWSLSDIVKRLNPLLRGWMNYFRFGNSSRKFSQMDSYVHEMLALWWSKKHQKRGRRWTQDFMLERRNACGIQRLSGNVVYWKNYLRMRKKEGHRKAV